MISTYINIDVSILKQNITSFIQNIDKTIVKLKQVCFWKLRPPRALDRSQALVLVFVFSCCVCLLAVLVCHLFCFVIFYLSRLHLKCISFVIFVRYLYLISSVIYVMFVLVYFSRVFGFCFSLDIVPNCKFCQCEYCALV